MNEILPQNLGLYAKLVTDYLNEAENLKAFYNRFPSPKNYSLQIAEKAKHNIDRLTLNEVLTAQYASDNRLSNKSEEIAKLLDKNTFTVTTGHQIGIFGGPLYFIYKIAHTIRLAAQIQAENPNKIILPVFWMATEDHDFEEINHIHIEGHTLTWHTKAGGPTGKIKTESLKPIIDALADILPPTDATKYLTNLFTEAYTNSIDLAAATRYWVDAIFADTPLIILDANDKALKQIFLPIMLQDIAHKHSYNAVNKTNTELEKNYKIQAHPREVNFFHITDISRERIIFENDTYTWADNVFTYNELEAYISEFPERFSPNVILRPVYQEAILPNIAYLGGGGEIAYWLQLKSTFEALSVPFPILQVRHSHLIVDDKSMRRIQKLELSTEDLFLEENVLIKKYLKRHNPVELDLEAAKNGFSEILLSLGIKVKKVDSTLEASVAAQLTKVNKQFEGLEHKILKAQKLKSENEVLQIHKIKAKLFPETKLQERYDNFLIYYAYNQLFVTNILQNKIPETKTVLRLLES